MLNPSKDSIFSYHCCLVSGVSVWIFHVKDGTQIRSYPSQWSNCRRQARRVLSLRSDRERPTCLTTIHSGFSSCLKCPSTLENSKSLLKNDKCSQPTLGFQCLYDFRDNITEEEYRAAKMKGRCDDEPRKPRVRKVKDKTPLWSSPPRPQKHF